MSSKSKNYTSLSAIASNASTSASVDILLSSAWPAAITELTAAPVTTAGASPLDAIVRATKPRYHFVPGAGERRTFWEREPYVWDDENGRISRFVGLGAFGGEQGTGKKQRVRIHVLSSLQYANPTSGSMRSQYLLCPRQLLLFHDHPTLQKTLLKKWSQVRSVLPMALLRVAVKQGSASKLEVCPSCLLLQAASHVSLSRTEHGCASCRIPVQGLPVIRGQQALAICSHPPWLSTCRLRFFPTALHQRLPTARKAREGIYLQNLQ
jgi:hypothetical protein